MKKHLFTRLLCAAAALIRGPELVAYNIAAGEHPTGRVTLAAAAALPKSHVILIGGTAAGQATINTAAGTALPLGIAESDALAGEMLTVSLLGAATGTLRVRAGAAIAAYAQITADTTGRAVAASSGKYVIGTALQAATGADELIEFAPAYPSKI